MQLSVQPQQEPQPYSQKETQSHWIQAGIETGTFQSQVARSAT